MGKALAYIPSITKGEKLIVQLEKDDILVQANHWSIALIGYVLRESPFFKIMENYIAHVWNFVSKLKVLYHDDGYYIFKFATLVDRDLVLQPGPYTYRNRPLILRNWTLDFEFNPDYLNKVPLWVKFSSLPLGFWLTESLSNLTSVVGKPMYTDKYTTEMERTSYVRVLVNNDIIHTLPTFGHIVDKCPYKKKPEKEEQDNPPLQQGRRRRNCRRRRVIQQWEVKEEDKANLEQTKDPEPIMNKSQMVKQSDFSQHIAENYEHANQEFPNLSVDENVMKSSGREKEIVGEQAETSARE
ncbi:hypothetical protein P3S68_004118 [Capsicum galapagoense]